MPKLQLNAAKQQFRKYAAIAAHSLLLLEMRIEAWLSRFGGGREKHRVIATACWHFPIYSQTFVYRELSELAKNGFTVRFLYSALGSRQQLADGSSRLWDLKRRLILSDATAQRDLMYYQRKMPERVREIAEMLSRASGMTVDEVFANEHFRHAFSFTRMAECWRADYIHTYFFYERTLFALVASHLLGIPRGVSCYADHMLKDYHLKLIPLHMQTCDVVVATSARIKQELEALAGRSLPQVIVKPNAIDAGQFPRNESSPTISGPCRIVTVSRIHPKKGLTHLLDAAELLREQGVSATVSILGAPDTDDTESCAYYDEVRERIEKRNLGDIVRLEGQKTSVEVRRHLSEADIFVAPFIELPNGDKDGIPTALLEAMASGCAIVATNAGSITEVVRGGMEGIVVPQRDANALAHAIVKLIQDDGLRLRVSRAAFERVMSEFDVRKCEGLFHDRVHAAIKAGPPNMARSVAAI